MESLFDYFMFAYGGEIVVMIVTAVFGMLGVAVKNLVKKYLNNKTAQDVAKTVVLFVEQCFKDLHGEEKLTAALNRASEVLTAKGIEVSAFELETLIEAAVAEFNEAFKK
jgi:LL-H family phage holin